MKLVSTGHEPYFANADVRNALRFIIAVGLNWPKVFLEAG